MLCICARERKGNERAERKIKGRKRKGKGNKKDNVILRIPMKPFRVLVYETE